MLQWLGSLLVVITAVQALEFVVAYHRQTRGAWREKSNPMGRHLMAFMASIAAVLSLAAISNVLRFLDQSDPTWFRWLRLAVFVSVPIVLLWRRILLARVQSQTEE